MAEHDIPTVCVLAPAALAPAFVGLLRQGVGVCLAGPKSVRAFLLEDVGLDLEYATHRLPGLFLNGVAVDDWETAQVAPGDEVALSGTMPGLAGIALRRGSPLKGFRADLAVAFRTQETAPGVVLLRPFNFVAQDVVQPLLARGVRLAGDALAAYVQTRAEELAPCRMLDTDEPLLEAVRRRRLLDAVRLMVQWRS